MSSVLANATVRAPAWGQRVRETVLLPLLVLQVLLPVGARGDAAAGPDLATAATAVEVTPAQAEALRQADALQAQDPARAAAVLEAALKTAPNPLLQHRRGLCLQAAGQAQAATAEFAAALAARPDFREARLALLRALLERRDLDAAEAHVRWFLAQPVPPAPFWALLGFARLTRGDAVSAETAYRQALLQTPDDGAARTGLAEALLRQGRHEAAAPLLRAELAASAGHPDLWQALATAELAAGREREALVHLECARRLGLATPVMLALLGDLYLREGLIGAAGTAYRAAAADPGLPPDRLLAAAAAMADAGQAELATALLNHAAQTLPEESRWRLSYVRGKLAAHAGETTQALRHLEEALSLAPLDGALLLTAADQYCAVERYDDAVLCYERALRQPATQLPALLGRARVAMAQGDRRGAISWLERAQALRDQPAVAAYLAQLRASLAAAP